jgi:hypothetical protein
MRATDPTHHISNKRYDYAVSYVMAYSREIETLF